MNVNAKYLKDENGQIISPIVSADTIYNYSTTNLNLSELLSEYYFSGCGIDTKWIDLVPLSEFRVYPDAKYPSIRRINNFVCIVGVVAPALDFEAGTSHNILTLPNKNEYNVNFIPSYDQYFVCQGSRRYQWLLTVTTSGIVRFSRYGRTDYDPCTTDPWLPFNVIYPVFG